MPFAGYENFEACVSANTDKEDAKAYCATIMNAVEGSVKNSGWLDVEPWYNDRVIETFISAPVKDSQGDLIETKTFAEIMPWLKEYGYYEWQHSGFPIGKIIGWCIKDGKPMIRVGLHDSVHSGMKVHDKIWKIVQQYGTRAFSSIKGLPELQRRIREGGTSINVIERLGVYGVGWVGGSPANPEARVTYVNEIAKSDEQLVVLSREVDLTIAKGDLVEQPVEKVAGLSMNDSKLANEIGAVAKMSWEECIAQATARGADDPEKLCGWLQYHGPNAAPKSKQTLGRGTDEKPPKDWWDNCTARAASFADDVDTFCGGLWFHPENFEGGESMRESFGKSDEPLLDTALLFATRDGSVPTAEQIVELCGRCRQHADRLVSTLGVDKSSALMLIQKRLDSIAALIKNTREAKHTTAEDDKKRADAEAAAAAEKAKTAAAAAGERNFAAEIDALKKSVDEIGGLRKAVDELAAAVSAVATSVAEIQKTNANAGKAGEQTKTDDRLSAIEKRLKLPAREQRGSNVEDTDVEKQLGDGLKKSDVEKLGRGELALEEWRKTVGVKR